MKFLFKIFFVLFLFLNVAYSSNNLRVIPDSKNQIMLSYAPIVKKSAPAVVNIYTSKKVRVKSYSPFFNDPFFQRFFGSDIFSGRQKQKVENSLGSGVIISDNGYILTSNHVVENSDEVNIVLNDKREFVATIIVNDKKTDLALLKIDTEGEKLPFIALEDSDKLQVGDLVLAIGNPFGVGQTVTGGIISALARNTVGVSDYQFFIQTDAAINPGNSGGALVTMDGKLAGINTAIFSKSGGSHGIGFAIPSNMASAIIRQYSKSGGGKLIRPWLGASGQNITQDVANSLGIKNLTGVLLKAIYPGSALDKAGIKVGDLVTHVNGHQIENIDALRYRVATFAVDDVVEFKIIRGRFVKKYQVTMMQAIEEPKRDIRYIESRSPLYGALVANISPAIVEELALPDYIKSGVVIYGFKNRNSNLGIKIKDVIFQINGVDVKSTKHLEELLSEEVYRWQISLKRDGRIFNIISNNY